MFFLESLDTSLLIAAGASFVAGVFGYIIARFWVRPLVRYQITKRKLNRNLSDYLSRVDDAPGNPSGPLPTDAASLHAARRHGMALVACFNKDLPYWYRLLLESRRESPMEASGLLTNLAKLRDRRQIEKRIAEARHKLNLK